VKAALKYDDIHAAGVVPSKLYGAFHRFGSRIGKIERVQMRGYDFMQSMGELDQGLVKVAIHLRVNRFCSLFLNGPDDPGMAVAGVGDADAAGKIQVFSAIDGVDVTTITVIDDQIRRATPDGGNVREIVWHRLMIKMIRGAVGLRIHNSPLTIHN
jgi:hypothetical protein